MIENRFIFLLIIIGSSVAEFCKYGDKCLGSYKLSPIKGLYIEYKITGPAGATLSCQAAGMGNWQEHAQCQFGWYYTDLNQNVAYMLWDMANDFPGVSCTGNVGEGFDWDFKIQMGDYSCAHNEVAKLNKI